MGRWPAGGQGKPPPVAGCRRSICEPTGVPAEPPCGRSPGAGRAGRGGAWTWGPVPCILLYPVLAHDRDATFRSSMAVECQPWKSGCTWLGPREAKPAVRALSPPGPRVWPAPGGLGASEAHAGPGWTGHMVGRGSGPRGRLPSISTPTGRQEARGGDESHLHVGPPSEEHIASPGGGRVPPFCCCRN